MQLTTTARDLLHYSAPAMHCSLQQTNTTEARHELAHGMGCCSRQHHAAQPVIPSCTLAACSLALKVSRLLNLKPKT